MKKYLLIPIFSLILPLSAFAAGSVSLTGTSMGYGSGWSSGNIKVFDANASNSATRLQKIFTGGSWNTSGRTETLYQVFDGVACGDGDNYGDCKSRLIPDGGQTQFVYKDNPNGNLSFTAYVPPIVPSTISASTGGTLIYTGFGTISKYALIILGSVITIIVALLLFRWGLSHIWRSSEGSWAWRRKNGSFKLLK